MPQEARALAHSLAEDEAFDSNTAPASTARASAAPASAAPASAAPASAYARAVRVPPAELPLATFGPLSCRPVPASARAAVTTATVANAATGAEVEARRAPLTARCDGQHVLDMLDAATRTRYFGGAAGGSGDAGIGGGEPGEAPSRTKVGETLKARPIAVIASVGHRSASDIAVVAAGGVGSSADGNASSAPSPRRPRLPGEFTVTYEAGTITPRVLGPYRVSLA